MKWLFVILNIAAAIGVLWGGAVVCGVHRVHSYSTYVWLDTQGALAPGLGRATAPAPADPGKVSGEDIQERLRNIGGLDGNLPVVTYTAAGLFLLNAIVLSVVWKKKPVASSPPR